MKPFLMALPAFFKNQRGQTSVEIAIVSGAILMISVTMFPYLVEANTLNKGISSARDGATFAQTMINMGYTSDDFSGATLPQGDRVHVDRVGYLVEREYMPDTDRVSITLTISGTSDNNIAQQVQNQAGDFIYFNFYGAWPSTSTYGVVEMEGYQFMVSYELV
jgi:hypothetical protein